MVMWQRWLGVLQRFRGSEILGLEKMAVSVHHFHGSPAVPIHHFADARPLLSKVVAEWCRRSCSLIGGTPAALQASANVRVMVYGLYGRRLAGSGENT